MRHIDTEILNRYVRNELSPKEETLVQEHISSCRECAGKVRDLRALSAAFFEKEHDSSADRSLMFRILHSYVTVAAAAIMLTGGIAYFILEASRDRAHFNDTFRIENGKTENPPSFAIDTFDKEDTAYYREKYGDDFLKK